MGQFIHSGRGPSSVEPLAAEASFSSIYFQTLEFGKLTGICYQEGISNVATGSLLFTVINNDEKFILTSSIADLFTYSSSDTPLPADTSNVFFFATSSDGGSAADSLTGSLENLVVKIQSTTGSFVIEASRNVATLQMSASVSGTVGNNISFQSGSANVTLDGGTAPAASSGSLQIQQSSTTSALAEVTGNIIPIANAEGVEFSVELTGELVRLSYQQTSSAQGIFRLNSYLRPI